MTRLLIVAALLAAVLAPPAAAAPALEVVTRIPATGLTEIAWDGDTVFVGELNGTTGRNQTRDKGGVHILDASGEVPVPVDFLPCDGSDTDVVVVKPGLIAIAHHRSACNTGFNAGNLSAQNNGMFLVDVSDPEVGPRVVGGVRVPSAHTLTPMPGTDYVYVHPGGLGVGGGVTSIVDVSDPTRPRVAGSFTPSAAGCHDLQFLDRRPIAFCASGGAGEIQTWDVTNPIAPKIIGRTVNPAIQFPHNAVPSPDGRYLVVNDEAFAVHECATGAGVLGALWVYDISDPANPVPVSRIAPPRGPNAVNAAGGTAAWCTAHNYTFIPGTRTLVASWFTGGTTVEDLSDPLLPRRIAHYQPPDADTYSAAWHDGLIYTADMRRGIEVLRLTGLAEGALTGPIVDRPRVDRTDELLPPGWVAPTRAPHTGLRSGGVCVL
jgi:hypothetical protein